MSVKESELLLTSPVNGEKNSINNNDETELEFDNNQVVTSVSQMYAGRSIFITGASGFIGRVLLEKLLRTYQGIKRVYILLRSKRNVPPQERLNKQLLKVPIFDAIRAMKNGQELLDKIVIVPGDIGEEGLGISPADMKTLLEDKTLSVVFHSAATVKFDELLRTSVRFNVIATKAIIDFCKKLPNLISLCHVSTAYANSDITDGRDIEERLYPMKQNPEELIKLVHSIDDNQMQKLKPTLIGERPNTYTYTKALAEHLIALEASDLPVAIVRPSIVVAAWKEPLRGWVDNLNGPTGLVLAIGKGLLRSMYVKRDGKADLIPVDIVVNTMIAASFYAAKTRDNQLVSVQEANGCKDKKVTFEQPETQVIKANNQEQQNGSTERKVPPIFHCTSGDIKPITWGEMEDSFFNLIRKYPSQQVLRYPFGTFKSNKYHDFVTRLIVHYLPALIIDLICLVMGKKRQLMNIYYKLHCAVEVLSNFLTQNYNFKTTNSKLLKSCLTTEEDKQQLYMDIRSLDWFEYWDDYVLGARRFVLKEEDHTLEKARESFKKAYYIEIAFRVLLLIMASIFCLPLISNMIPYLNSALTTAT